MQPQIIQSAELHNFTPVSRFIAALHRKNSLSGFNVPALTGLFHTILHGVSVTAFDCAAAYKISLFLVLWIVHTLLVTFHISYLISIEKIRNMQIMTFLSSIVYTIRHTFFNSSAITTSGSAMIHSAISIFHPSSVQQTADLFQQPESKQNNDKHREPVQASPAAAAGGAGRTGSGHIPEDLIPNEIVVGGHLFIVEILFILLAHSRG